MTESKSRKRVRKGEEHTKERTSEPRNNPESLPPPTLLDRWLQDQPPADAISNVECTGTPSRISGTTRISNVLDSIKENHFDSLTAFLCRFFSSKDKEIMERVRYFFYNKGPDRVIEAWRDCPHYQYYIDSTGRAAGSLVKNATLEELTTLTHEPNLRLSSTNVKAKDVTKFSVEDLAVMYKNKAPVLFNLLFSLASENPDSDRDSNVIVPTIISMLLITKARTSNYLPKVFSLFLYSTGASKKVLEVFSSVGLSVSYNSVAGSLTALTKDALKMVRNYVHNPRNCFIVVYDNVNMAFKKLDQRLENQDEFQSGATAEVIAVSTEPETDSEEPCGHLLLEDLYTNESDSIHRRQAFKHHLVGVLIRYFNGFELCKVEPPATTNRLIAKKTKTFTLPAKDSNQATTDGNKDILQSITSHDLQLPNGFFNNGRRLILAGDLLTVDRIKKIMAQRWDDVSIYHKFKWAFPILQLFHLQLNLLSLVLKTHYGDKTVHESLGFNAHLLGRKRISEEKADYHAARELLCHSFDALVIKIWQEEIGHKDLTLFAEQHSEDTLPSLINHIAGNIISGYFTTQNLSKLNGDGSRNAALFLRDMMFYLELSSAIKSGDIGRILRVLKYITIIFQAGKTKNYGAELLHLYCGLEHKWTKKTRQAVFESWLVNPTGEKNRFIPTDLFQEHNNRLLKDLHAAKGSTATWGLTERSISTNIHTLQKIKKNMQRQFSTPKNKDHHEKVDATADVETIMRSNSVHSILSKEPQNQQTTTRVKDLMEQGYIRIQKASKTGSHMACKRLVKPKRPQPPNMSDRKSEGQEVHPISTAPEHEHSCAPDSGSESEYDAEPEAVTDPESDEDTMEFELDTFLDSET
ncbi:hypothetical protein MVEG_12295 [Podila verticillata NRRL 6337]|uniref:DUF6589 domain-containing protein n=1 Tax=Podila verticillata NRRL 6337 TaxID=1069443 RepID=A0A086TIT9_9FUNG|nr:hypothetical protein MVEG_12295 [Podila verticillata NRRL 6337]